MGMILTKEIIDVLTPEHGRTSCDDDNISNSFGGWTGKYNEDTGQKVIRYPRCNRCYLLDNIGSDIDSLEFKIEVGLRHILGL